MGADGTGAAAESIVNQTAVDVLRRLPVSLRQLRHRTLRSFISHMRAKSCRHDMTHAR